MRELNRLVSSEINTHKDLQSDLCAATAFVVAQRFPVALNAPFHRKFIKYFQVRNKEAQNVSFEFLLTL